MLKLEVLEEVLAALAGGHGGGSDGPHPAVCLSLHALERWGSRPTVAAMARSAGISERRLRDLFCEEVGVPPKLYSRIVRFRHAMERLHRGDDIAWAELALQCGFSDQSHFCNEFRAFSGVDPTTYSRSSRPWSGHLAI